MLAQHGYTIVNGLARGCDTAATEGALSVGGNVIGVVPRGLKSLQGHTKNLLKKSSLREGQSFLNTLTTSQKYSVGTIYDAMQLSRGFPKKRLLSQLRSDRDRLRLQTTLYVKGREVIITRYVKAKIQDATIVKNLGDLKDALGMDREDSGK